MLNLIVFDWDGTLIDSQARIVQSLEEAIIDLDAQPKDRKQLSSVIGLGLGDSIRRLFPDADVNFVKCFADAYRTRFLADDKLPSPVFPGTHGVLKHLKASAYLLGVATGKARSGLERGFEETGIGHYFDATRCADETESKPHPQMLIEIMAELEVLSSETLMVGDTEFDMEMATQANAHAIAASYGVHDTDRLKRHRPLAMLKSITELPMWLRDNAQKFDFKC